jgi:hypothetical protein
MKPTFIPMDYGQLPEVKLLEQAIESRQLLNSRAIAHAIFLRLWVDLGHHGAFHPLGLLPRENLPGLCSSLKLQGIDPADIPSMLINKSKLLAEFDAGYFCNLFAEANKEGWHERWSKFI